MIIKHVPTGLTIRCESERSQQQNRLIAKTILVARLQERHNLTQNENRAADRKSQVGSGMRGDKIKTYREQDDAVMDHRTGKRQTLKSWRRGDWDSA